MNFILRKEGLLIILSILITACSPKLTCDSKEYLDEIKVSLHDTALSRIGRVHPSVREAVQNATITFNAISEPTKVSASEISCSAQVSTQYTFVGDGKTYTSTNPITYNLAITSNENGDKQASYTYYGGDVIASLVGNAKEDDKFSWMWDRFGNSQTKPKVSTENTESIQTPKENSYTLPENANLGTDVVPQNDVNTEAGSENEPYELPDPMASEGASQANP